MTRTRVTSGSTRWAQRRIRLATLVLAAAVVGATIGVATRQRPGPHAPNGRLTVSHAQLAVEVAGHARRVDLTGINVYNLTSDWSANAGCGYGGWTDPLLAQLFGAMRPGSLVRTWFFQSMATSGTQRDWASLDRVVNYADRYHVRLIAVLGNGNGACDDNTWKDAGWYAGGYRRSTGGIVSYATWVREVVGRYAGNQAIGIWEPVNEPNPVACPSGGDCASTGTCVDQAAATDALWSFFTAVGSTIHRLDPWSLVSDGSLGTGNCGTQHPADYGHVIDSPGLDVMSYHDYSGAGITLPDDVERRVRQASALGKATTIEESGITACGTAQDRADDYARKISAAFAAGATAYLPWWYGTDPPPESCNDAIDTESPTWGLLNTRTWTPTQPRSNTPATVQRGPT